MRTFIVCSLLATAVAAASFGSSTRTVAAQAGGGATFSSIGPLTFAPDGTLFAGDTVGAAIVALDLRRTSGARKGTGDVPNLDQTIAAMLGTDRSQVLITDIAVHPATMHTYVSVMRGEGAAAQPALLRVDGAGAVTLVDTAALRSSQVAIGDAPKKAAFASPFSMDYVKVGPEYVHQNPRVRTITDMAYVSGQLIVAGLSNEEFNSTLRAIPYPFKGAAGTTNVEIYHANHAQLETRSPIYTFVPYTIGGEPSLIAGYLCTPLVTLPIASLKPGAHVRGRTIGEFGNGNRPLDMVVYSKGGQDYVLMANNRRGVMKIPTAPFAGAAAITTPIKETGGVPFETVTSLTGVEQLDGLDGTRAIVLARSASKGLDLRAVALP
ncbi:MAG: hypothetical protein AB7I25_07075 [Vicinamibacterales bacterium]